jgi:hypothetical protein
MILVEVKKLKSKEANVFRLQKRRGKGVRTKKQIYKQADGCPCMEFLDFRF